MIKVGDRLRFDITETNMMASGVAKCDGMVVFCEGAVEGDTVVAEISEIRKNCAVAKTLKVEVPSPYRTEPECPYFEECGGCAFQHVTYSHEKELKKKGVASSFRRCGAFVSEVDTIICGSDKEYRNKAVFRFDKNKNVGYYSKGTNKFLPVEKCLLADRAINNIMKKTREIIRGDKKIEADALTYLYIRYMKETDEASVVLGYTGESDLSSFADKLTSVCPCVKCIMQGSSDNPESRSERLVSVWGKEKLDAYFCGMTLRVSPSSFFQVNHEASEKLCNTVAEMCSLQNGERALDLYCGTGVIGLNIAKHYPDAEVIGTEINPKAIENAKETAALNGIKNIEFFCGDSSDFADDVSGKIDCVTVDPPRAGLSDKAVSELLRIAPKRIVYVSCNPSTLSRDLKKLLASYEIKHTVAVDMFPRTSHVESVVKLTRAGL